MEGVSTRISPGNPTSADESPDGEIDAEVSFFTRELAGVLPRAKLAAVLPIDDVIARVRDIATWSGNGPQKGPPPDQA